MSENPLLNPSPYLNRSEQETRVSLRMVCQAAESWSRQGRRLVEWYDETQAAIQRLDEIPPDMVEAAYRCERLLHFATAAPPERK